MPSGIIVFLVFFVGCCLGSFLNVCIYRLPRDLSIILPGSHCPRCQTPIRFYDNIPLVSYLLLGGKCRKCQDKISWGYPLVEALTGVLAVALYTRFGLTLHFFPFFALTAALIVITFIDLEHRIIPDIISLPGIVIGAGIAIWAPWITLQDSLIGALIGGGSLFVVAIIYEKVTKREGMGMGDVKLLAMIGAWLGWEAVLFTIFLASLTGTIIGGIAMLVHKQGRHYALPFGPFLAFAAIAYIFWGTAILDWYLGFRGP
jgi:leader peptidase (prepilin peptidase) / N-methyltransferase